MQSNGFMFVFSTSLMVLKLPIISSLSCLLAKTKTHILIDLSSIGRSFISLLISVNFLHFLILLYLLLSLDGLVIMIFSNFFYFPLFIFPSVPFPVLNVAEQGANDCTQPFTTGCVHLYECASSCSLHPPPALHVLTLGYICCSVAQTFSFVRLLCSQVHALWPSAMPSQESQRGQG